MHKRSWLVSFLSVILCAAAAPALCSEENAIFLPATDFQTVNAAETRNFGGVPGVLFKGTNSLAETVFSVPQKGAYELWFRVYFTWAGSSESLSFTLDGQTTNQVTAQCVNPYLWNVGNFQVWHWFRGGRFTLEKGTHKLAVKAQALVRLNQVAIYSGTEAWKEAWLTDSLAQLSEREPRHVLKEASANIAIEAETLEVVDARLEKAGEIVSVRLENDGDRVAGLVMAEKPVAARIWLRVYFHNKNMFEGRTMEEMANQLYFAIDGGLQKTVYAENGMLWYWADAGIYEFGKGKHLLSCSKSAGKPIQVDKLLLASTSGIPEEVSNDAVPQPLPFGLRNNIAWFQSRRVADYLMFGELAPETKADFLGKQQDQAELPVRLQLPKQSGWLVLEKLQGVPSNAAHAADRRESQISLWLSGNAPDARVGVIYRDRTGEEFLTWLVSGIDWKGQRLVSHNVPLSLLERRGVFYDRTGEAPDEFLSPVATATNMRAVAEQAFVEGGNGDGLPDYPLEIKYVVIQKTGSKPGEIVFGEPFFEDPFRVSAALTANEETPEGQRVTVQLTVANASEAEKTAQVYYNWRIEPFRFLNEKANLRTPETRGLNVPPRGKAEFAYVTTLTKKGIYKFLYSAGQGRPGHLFMACGDEARTRLAARVKKAEGERGCFTFAPLKKKDGGEVRQEDVAALYGKMFAVYADGLDAASRAFADRLNIEQRLKPEGWDLSDNAGWPEIEVPPGIIAIDPVTGRGKFCHGNSNRMAIAGVLNTGFAATGHNITKKGDFVYVSPGEAEYTVVDVSNRQKPEFVRTIPIWHWSHGFLFYGNYAYFNASHRGLMLVDDISNPYRPGYCRKVEYDFASYGGFTKIYPEQGIAVSVTQSKAYFHSLKSPLHPEMLAEIAGTTNASAKYYKSQFNPSPDNKFAFMYLEDGQLGLLDTRNPAKPIIRNRFDIGGPSNMIAAVSDRYLATVSGQMIRIFKYSEKALEPAGSLKIPPKCGHMVFAFNGNLFYLIDGNYGWGEHGMAYGSPRSRWFVYKIQENAEPVNVYEDDHASCFTYMIIEGNTAYVSDFNFGLWIFDLTNPEKPVKLAGAVTAGESDALCIDGDRAYMWQTFDGATFIIDIANPEKPRRLSEYWDGGWVDYENTQRSNHTIGGKDGYFYVPKSGGPIIIVNATNPSQPKRQGELTDATNAPLCNSGACILVQDDRAYVIAYNPSAKQKNRFLVLDVTNAAKPATLAELSLPEGVNTLCKHGDAVYLAGTQALFAVSLKDERKPVIAAKIGIDSVLTPRESIASVAVRDQHAYLAIRGHPLKLAIVDMAGNPPAVRICTPFLDLLDAPCSSWGSQYQDLIVEGKYLFIGNYARIECLDISDPDNPVLADKIEIGYQWSVGRKKGQYLYVPTLKGLVVLDTPNGSQAPQKAELKIVSDKF